MWFLPQLPSFRGNTGFGAECCSVVEVLVAVGSRVACSSIAVQF